ncbi:MULTISPECIES: translation initiation factor 2 [Gammaproteobacteria]|uniref:Translation initiation factor 2 n=1 Tax=Oceanimonas baumannii TaxID=129578 RepID=A0A235C6K6_9GAMM|nr:MULTISPECIES: translation initiation factor 2 [Gammaproteobacteria]OXS22965.1 translation initiation factor 2 [Pseudomonas fluorescens]KAF6693967.1 translation initiation factor 2 [Pseudomonas sp. EKM23D]OYD20066.1 translation initiation factor 2 [Oceanimonas baumannii]OZO49929.1 translation initiation factor 2 [Pseudomonas fluorescens]QKJ74831.1 translation initiation factor 2 [Pseudomonas rhodesiae]
MTSMFRAVLVIGLLSLCNVPTLLAATPVSESKPAASAQNTKPAPAKTAASAKKNAAAKKRAAAKKAKSAHEVAETKLPPAQLDLSLPSDMVRHLQPLGTMPQPKSVPLLPPMFGEKPTDNSAFQINGRLLSNEMRLQLRNEERRDVEGAALDFEFKQ